MVLLFFKFNNLKAEGRAIGTTGELPWRYWGATWAAVLEGKMRFRHGGDRKVTTPSVSTGFRRCSRGCRGAKKITTSVPFRFGSDDPLGVGGVSWR